MSNLVKRLLTAAVLIPVLLAALFLDPTVWSIMGLTALCAAIGIDEFLRMSIPASDADRAWGIRAVAWIGTAGTVVMATMIDFGRVVPAALTVMALCLSAAVLMRKKHLEHAGRHFMACLSALIYVPLLFSVWPLLKKGGFGEEGTGGAWLMLTLSLAFLSDTVAYFAGRAFGKKKLYEAVSPNKTIAGGLGGLVGGAAACVGFGSVWLLPEIPIWHAIILGVLGSVCGQIGDLVESMIKRTFGVKDSGNVLPGHGGMLDRTDALMFVAPLVFYYAKFIPR